MAAMNHRLTFERPIYELDARLAKLEAEANGSHEVSEEIRRLRRELAETKKRIYSQLRPWETVQVARHDEHDGRGGWEFWIFDF